MSDTPSPQPSVRIDEVAFWVRDGSMEAERATEIILTEIQKKDDTIAALRGRT